MYNSLLIKAHSGS